MSKLKGWPEFWKKEEREYVRLFAPSKRQHARIALLNIFERLTMRLSRKQREDREYEDYKRCLTLNQRRALYKAAHMADLRDFCVAVDAAKIPISPRIRMDWVENWYRALTVTEKRRFKRLNEEFFGKE